MSVDVERVREFINEQRARRDERNCAMKRFLEVRRILNKPDTMLAYNKCYKMPWRFYRTHTVEEAVTILTEGNSGDFQ